MSIEALSLSMDKSLTSGVADELVLQGAPINPIPMISFQESSSILSYLFRLRVQGNGWPEMPAITLRVSIISKKKNTDQ
jgi:hypothetical protein